MSPRRHRILLVERDRHLSRLAKKVLCEKSPDLKLTVVASLDEARLRLNRTRFDLVITDLMFSEGRGIELLSQRERNQTPVVVMAESGDETMAVEAIKAGALDYVLRSEETIGDLDHIIERTLREWQWIQARRGAEEAVHHRNHLLNRIMNTSPAGILVVDRKKRIRYANPKAEDVLELKRRPVRASSAGDDVSAFLEGPSPYYPVSNWPLGGVLDKGRTVTDLRFQRRFRQGGMKWISMNATPFTDENGETDGAVVTVEDITDRLESEEALARSEKKFHSITGNVPVGIFRFSPAGKGSLQELNRSMATILGYPDRKSLQAVPVSRLFASEQDYREFLRCVMKEPVIENWPVTLKRHDGRTIWASLTAIAVRNGGEVESIDGILQDVTARHEIQEKLAASEARFRMIAENTFDVIWVVDAGLNYSYISPSVAQQRGYSQYEILACRFDEMYLEEDLPMIRDTIEAVKREGPELNRPRTLEARIRHRNGEIRWVEIVGKALFGQDGRFQGIHGVTRDITERKWAEEQVRKSLEEKNVLLKEIHHRVKNNMQIICSLLALQSKFIEDPVANRAFSVCGHRVRSMALIHEELYQAPDMSRIHPVQYIHRLSQGLYRIHHRDPARVPLHVHGDEIPFSLDIAVPCGLILNELISNCLAHAFPPDFSGKPRIDVSISRGENHTLKLSVQDNGVGFPRDFDWVNSRTLGLRMVSILAEDQLRGCLDVETASGTRFNLEFPMDSGDPAVPCEPAVPGRRNSVISG